MTILIRKGESILSTIFVDANYFQQARQNHVFLIDLNRYKYRRSCDLRPATCDLRPATCDLRPVDLLIRYPKFIVSLLLVGCTAATVSAQAQLTLALAPSNYNGYNVKCFGGKSGSIDLTVTGGTAPYYYDWSDGSTTEDLTGLPANYYKVGVHDSNGLSGDAAITLTQPEALKVVSEAFKYPTGTNISCYECYNGSIDVSVFEGVAPYTYDWGDEVYTQDRSGLGAQNYQVIVTDANGCYEKSEPIFLKQPDSDDWKMGGNANTYPGPQFIGTSDAKDVVFKSNGVEAIRLKSNGEIALHGTGIGAGLLYRDSNGIIHGGGGWPPGPVDPPVPAPPCYYLTDFVPTWLTTGNNFTDLCPEEHPKLGTLSSTALTLITNATERMRITPTGLIGIGTNDPQDQLEVHTTMDRGGLRLVNATNTANQHTEIRFMKKQNGTTAGRWALGCDFDGTGSQDFFLWDHVASQNRIVVNAQGKVGIGTQPPINGSLYNLYVQDGIATRDVKVTSGVWPDYVFEPTYKLMPLSELKVLLHEIRHLPGIPSAADISKNEGYEVGDMQVRLLKVVEDQTLYILQLKEEQDQLRREVDELKKVVR